MSANRDILLKFISQQGYKKDSPDKNRPMNVIPSNRITMKDVEFPVHGMDNLGNERMMYPGEEHVFPGDYVVETPQMPFGGMSRRKVDKTLNANKDLNFVQRLYQENTPSIMIPGQTSPSTHFMESADGRVYPTVVEMPDGTLQYLGDNAYDYAMETGEYIQFPNDRQATRFGKSYKKGTGVLEESADEDHNYQQGGISVRIVSLPKAQTGGHVSDIWVEKTGLDWSEAKKQGYTTGSYDDNINLLSRLNSGEFDKSQKVSTSNNSSNVVSSPSTITQNLNFDSAPDFASAFKDARNQLGSNHTFTYKEKQYTTNTVSEPFVPSEDLIASNQSKTGDNSVVVKKKIDTEARKAGSPFHSKNDIDIEPKVWEDWDKVKQDNLEVNKMNNADVILEYHKNNPSQNNFVIVDKSKGLMHMYKPDGTLLFSNAFDVDVSANPGDAQTTTKYHDLNNNGIIDPEEIKQTNVNWDAGNKTTGAGKYYISNIDPTGYGGLPLLNMMNDRQYQEYLETGDVNQVSTSFHKGYVADDDNRVSNGCVRCNKTTLDALTNNLQNTSEVYILPEDEGNVFTMENGQLNFKTNHKSNLYTYKDNGRIYKKENNSWYVAPEVGSSFIKIADGSKITLLNKNATNAGYNYYVDGNGTVQKGQGINRTLNTLNHIPINVDINEEALKEQAEKYWTGGWDEKQYNYKIKPFVSSLQFNKQYIMEAVQINGDIYNDLVGIALGIFGTETNYGDEHSGGKNFLNALGKLYDSDSSSPDYMSKYKTYGADDEDNSVGLTQIRWVFLNDHEKEVLSELGITSSRDFLDPWNAAKATIAILGIRYNEQLTSEEKKDPWTYLPGTWNNRDNYADRVKNNSQFFNVQQITPEGEVILKEKNEGRKEALIEADIEPYYPELNNTVSSTTNVVKPIVPEIKYTTPAEKKTYYINKVASQFGIKPSQITDAMIDKYLASVGLTKDMVQKETGGVIDPTEVSDQEMKLDKRFRPGGLTYDATKAIYETKKLLSLLT